MFVVYTKNSIWYLKAKTTEDRDDWIEKLKFARYQSQSKSVRDEIKRLMHDLHFECDQRANLLRQVELQAKQLKVFEKSARRKPNTSTEEELSKLDSVEAVDGDSESEKEMYGSLHI
ncbi:unnamed protein product [Gongylonema pulchrum]|uniref:PH domain-containing protein n=1 Tax=Gongylonema pulchrum TaxID=637853 RepID=A0A183DY14_9BILA|nr:unnamed protein product [Gongylonema pulchrum]